jgi:hypothetical protein
VRKNLLPFLLSSFGLLLSVNDNEKIYLNIRDYMVFPVQEEILMPKQIILDQANWLAIKNK